MVREVSEDSRCVPEDFRKLFYYFRQFSGVFLEVSRRFFGDFGELNMCYKCSQVISGFFEVISINIIRYSVGFRGVTCSFRRFFARIGSFRRFQEFQKRDRGFKEVSPLKFVQISCNTPETLLNLGMP